MEKTNKIAELRAKIPWDTELYLRQGAKVHLCGIEVIHDFVWTDVFRNKRTQFRNGQRLAKLIKEDCPKEKTPVLLLTRKQDIGECLKVVDNYYITIVNIDRYLRDAFGDVATTYFTREKHINIISAANIDIDWERLPKENIQIILSRRMDPELVRSWLEADPAKIEMLIKVLKEMKVDTPQLISRCEAEITPALLLQLGDTIWPALQQAGAELPEAMAHRRLWLLRRSQVGEFKNHLEQGDWSESQWQRFLEKNTWIFGYGLSYQFLHTIKERPSLGGEDMTGLGSQKSDYLLATMAQTRFTVLVEIKRPDADLVTGTPYRNRAYHLGFDLIGGVAQLQQQCWRWAIEGSQTVENRDLLENQGIFTHEPKGILVIGNTASIRDDRNKRRTFESFRRNLHTPDIITFDELLCRAEKIVQVYAEDANGGTSTAQESVANIMEVAESENLK